MGTLALMAIMASVSQRALASEWTGWTRTELLALATSYLPNGCDPEGTTGLTSCYETYVPGVPYTVKHTNIPPSVTPVSSTTKINRDWDIEMATILLPPDAVPRSEIDGWYWFLSTSTNTPLRTSDLWMIDHTLTAPASCPTPFEFTTSFRLQGWGDRLPDEFLTDYLLPKATILPGETVTRAGAYPSILREIHVKPTDLPPTRHGGPPVDGDAAFYRWSLESYNQSFLAHCHLRGEPRPADRCPYTYAGKCSTIELWKIIIAAVIPFIFLLGFAESFFWFRRLMLGKTCLRMGTVCWILISVVAILFTIIEKKRSPEHQAEFREQWKKMSVTTKIKLWGQFGFRQRYPVDWLGARKPTGQAESIEMTRGGGTGGGHGGAGIEGQRVEDDTPPAYFPPAHEAGGTATASSGRALDDPNAVSPEANTESASRARPYSTVPYSLV
ncbi:hypothetical protein QBC41DRAFT_216882 [Cercophora samala]|uniref:Uncharacterized protein n=1 Tax=Cercophora samala TaxID=330535 RepID=A0AA40DDC9_9PEZI|nr:hypothetical protein QBC41DRAFT_216882 [Cercophora samala]